MFQTLATNKIFIGMCMIFMNMGSKYVFADLSSSQEAFLKTTLVKKFVIFCIFFVATRDLMVSCILTFAFVIVIYFILNDTSRFSVLPFFLSFASKSTQPKISQEDYNIAILTMQNFKKQFA
jgi:hypothetical protein